MACKSIFLEALGIAAESSKYLVADEIIVMSLGWCRPGSLIGRLDWNLNWALRDKEAYTLMETRKAELA